MKKSITYREITVAIGIVVAMVIVLTLWIRTPMTVSRSESTPTENPGFNAKNLIQNTAEFFLDPRKAL